jgi:hypothetical protein
VIYTSDPFIPVTITRRRQREDGLPQEIKKKGDGEGGKGIKINFKGKGKGTEKEKKEIDTGCADIFPGCYYFSAMPLTN